MFCCTYLLHVPPLLTTHLLSFNFLSLPSLSTLSLHEKDCFCDVGTDLTQHIRHMGCVLVRTAVNVKGENKLARTRFYGTTVLFSNVYQKVTPKHNTITTVFQFSPINPLLRLFYLRGMEHHHGPDGWQA